MGVVSHPLTPVEETLLTPLWARAYAGDMLPELGFIDQHAVALIVRIDAPRSRILTDPDSVAGMVLRTIVFDRLTQEFVKRHPDAAIVSVGVGLCARNLRLGPSFPSTVSWYGVDLPEVVALRHDLMPTDEMPLVTASIGEPGFLDKLDLAGRPTLVLAEGVLMYLESGEVHTFLSECAEQLMPGSQVIADIFHPIVVASGMHPISWATGASLKSGVVDAAHLARIVPGFVAVGEHDVFEHIGTPYWLASTWTRWLTLGGRIYCVARLQRT